MPKQRAPRHRREDADEEMRTQEEAFQDDGGAAEVNNAQVGEDMPPFDPKTFQHASISASTHPRIRAVTDGWDAPGVPLDHLALLVRECAVLLTEAGDLGEPLKLRELDKIMKEIVDEKASLNIRKSAAMDIRQELTNGVKIVKPLANWEKRVEEQFDAYQSKTARQRYADNLMYREYREEVWNTNPDNEGPMPPLKSMIPKEAGDADDSDEEIEVGGMAVSFKDPLTRTWLEDPHKSTLCGHTYSKASISEYLEGKSKACPAPGCNRIITMKDLERDENMARQVRNARRREEESQTKGKNKKNSIVVDSDDEIVG